MGYQELLALYEAIGKLFKFKFKTFAQPFQGKRILELGSGVGMLGISLLKTLPMKEYIFTDCHYKVTMRRYRSNNVPKNKPNKLKFSQVRNFIRQ